MKSVEYNTKAYERVQSLFLLLLAFKEQYVLSIEFLSITSFLNNYLHKFWTWDRRIINQKNDRNSKTNDFLFFLVEVLFFSGVFAEPSQALSQLKYQFLSLRFFYTATTVSKM